MRHRGDLPLAIRLENTLTHDSEFTDGYWLGYIRAKIEAGITFSCLIPDSLVPDAVVVVGELAESVYVGDGIEPNRYGVVFRTLTAWFVVQEPEAVLGTF